MAISSAVSNAATAPRTVRIGAPPVLTITQQPTATSVCRSDGDVQSPPPHLAASPSSGNATAAPPSAASPARRGGSRVRHRARRQRRADSGLARLQQQSATTNQAALLRGELAESAVTEKATQPIVVVDGQADISQGPLGICQEPSGSFLFGAATPSSDSALISARSPWWPATPPAVRPTARPQSALPRPGIDGPGQRRQHLRRRLGQPDRAAHRTDGTVSTLARPGRIGRFHRRHGKRRPLLHTDVYGPRSRWRPLRRRCRPPDSPRHDGGRRRRMPAAPKASPTALTAAAQFNEAGRDAVAANGDVLVSDSGNSRIRRILRSGNGAGAGRDAGRQRRGLRHQPRRHRQRRRHHQSLGSQRGAARSPSSTAPTQFAADRSHHPRGDHAGRLAQPGAPVTPMARSGPARLRLRPQAAVASGGFMLVDSANSAIRSISATGRVRTLATNRHLRRHRHRHRRAGADAAGALQHQPGRSEFRWPRTRPATAIVSGQSGQGGPARRDGRCLHRQPDRQQQRQRGRHGQRRAVHNVGPVTSASNGVIYVADQRCVRRIGTDHAVTVLAGVHALPAPRRSTAISAERRK